MYIILDESGTVDIKKNKYFIIGGFICKDVTKIRSLHKKVEKQIKLSNNIPLTKNEELKATNLKPQDKINFLNALLSDKSVRCFCIYYDVTDKHLLRNLQSVNDKFNYLIRQLLDNVFFEQYNLNEEKYILEDSSIHIRLDNRNIKVNYINMLQNYLKSEAKFIELGKTIVECKYFNSIDRREIQMADIIANTFWSFLNYPKTEKITSSLPQWNLKFKLYNYPKNYINNTKAAKKIVTSNFQITSYQNNRTITCKEEVLQNLHKLAKFKIESNNPSIKQVFHVPNSWRVTIYKNGNTVIQGGERGIKNFFEHIDMEIK